MCVYIYIYIGEFNASVSLCLEKKKSGRGDWGEGAAPPPKQNDKTYFHKQCYRQKHLHMSLYLFFVYLNIHKIYREVFCKCVFAS